MKKLIAFFSVLLLMTSFLYVGIELVENKPFGAEPRFEESVQVTITDQLAVHFLDIGQGDATFLEFPNGQQMLMDCAIDARILESLGEVMPYYDKSIDYLLITHPDKDHYGGCIDVLERFEVNNIILTGFQKEGSFFDSFEEAVQQEQANLQYITKSQTLDISGVELNFLYPTQDVSINPYVPNQQKKTGANDSSVVVLLSYLENKILFTGDAEEALEEFLVEEYGQELKADVYKASHHGSPGSSIHPFVEFVAPEHTIYSAGEGNSYGHPSLRVIRRMERLGSKQWRTDQQGDILVTIDSFGLTVSAQYE